MFSANTWDYDGAGEWNPGRQVPLCGTRSMPWLPRGWRRQESGHQQPCYWPSSLGIFTGFSTINVKRVCITPTTFMMTSWHGSISALLALCEWVGLGDFLRWWPLNHLGGSFRLSLFIATTRNAWIIPSFRIWGYVLHVEHVSCIIINLWPTSASHPFFPPNSSLGFSGGKYYQKIAIPIFRLSL